MNLYEKIRVTAEIAFNVLYVFIQTGWTDGAAIRGALTETWS